MFGRWYTYTCCIYKPDNPVSGFVVSALCQCPS